jgi:DNA-binding GntR family transcriptional regulator
MIFNTHIKKIKEDFMARKPSPSNKRNQIYDMLKEAILNGTYAGGSFLNESELCELYNVSRTPVREALIRLAQDNYIENIPNRGSFVPKLSISDIKELYELRIATDGMAVYLFTDRATPEHILAMEESIHREKAYLEKDDFIAAYSEELVFHSVYIKNCGNMHLINTIESVSNQMLRFMRLGADKNSQLRNSIKFHCQILDSVKNKDAEKARRIVEEHWSNNLQGYIKRYVDGTIPDRL